jgi:glutamyl-tRNA synthetase
MSRSVRVRFAPSPTGYLHVGSIRSGLFNWLWARHNHGVSVLRIEDTDRSRYVEDAIDQITDSMDTLGITPDEGPRQGGPYGPYIQSERLDLYHQWANTLLETGALYRCWCSPERLADLRTKAQKAGHAFKYDRYCLKPANVRPLDEPNVLRFLIPEKPASIAWHDAVRGRLEFKLTDLDDFVAIKADGYPTYQFANVIDDHLMEISHVMRADEWIPSTPKHLLLFQAFGWEPPIYAHLPSVQGPTGGKKLSKRDGAQSVQDYLKEGYLPEALMSFLASLGWNDGTTQEVYTTPELVTAFTLSRIQKSPARFDRERLTWMNGLLIRHMPRGELMSRSESFWPIEAADFPLEYRMQALRLIQERLKFLSEIPELTDFFFIEPHAERELLTKNYSSEEAAIHLTRLVEALNELTESDWNESELERAIRKLTQKHDLKVGHFFGLIRISITGRTSAPGLFETLDVLGKNTSLRRLQAAQSALSS